MPTIDFQRIGNVRDSSSSATIRARRTANMMVIYTSANALLLTTHKAPSDFRLILWEVEIGTLLGNGLKAQAAGDSDCCDQHKHGCRSIWCTDKLGLKASY
eukprot:scaffold98718_cov39-Cyclotella_meneghiniana.AAC.2